MDFNFKRKIWHNLPSWIKQSYYRNLKKISNIFTDNPVNVCEKNWNYLIVLDACRYDVFREFNFLGETLTKKISRGSSTREWLEKNFKDYYPNTVYISANPFVSNYKIGNFCGSDHFFKVEDVWEYAWDESVDTVWPSEVTDAVFEMEEKYPDKRKIVHYIQPHGPWIGETRIELESEIESKVPEEKYEDFNKEFWKHDIRVWELVKNGDFDIGRLFQAYKDNLKFVLKEVQRLISCLSGKVVVTADHGEAFGEYFVYGHPGGMRIPQLIEVP